MLADVQVAGDIAVLVALFVVASRKPLRIALGAAAVVEFGSVLAIFRWAPDGTRLACFVACRALTIAALVMVLMFVLAVLT